MNMMAMTAQDQSHEAHSCHSSQSRKLPSADTSPEDNVEGGASEQRTGINCGHFSIRGYASEIRKKNWKNNWPFYLPDDSSKLQECEDLLPPLLVTESRWWACTNCLGRLNSSETEVIPIDDSDDAAVPNVGCFKETSPLPHHHEHSAHRLKIPAKHDSNGNDNSEQMVQLGRDTSIGATKCVPNLSQENILGAFHYVQARKRGASKENSDGAISLDLNQPAYNSSDEVESSLSPVRMELEVSNANCGQITHVSNDREGCLNLSRDNLGTSHEGSVDVSDEGITLPQKDGILELVQEDRFDKNPREIDFGIKAIDSSLARVETCAKDKYKESDHVRDYYLANREELVDNESPNNLSSGSLKRKKAQKMRSLTDILKTKVLAAKENNGGTSVKFKNKKHGGEMGFENAEHHQTLRTCLSELQKVRNHERQKEMQKAKSISLHDEPVPTGQNTSIRKKNKTASYKNEQSTFIHGEATVKVSESSNMNADTTHLTHGRHREKIKKGNSQRSQVEMHDRERRKGDVCNHVTHLSSQELLRVPQNGDPEQRISGACREAAVDEIPMEIVELLARNRFEKRLNNFPEETENRSKSGPAVNYVNGSGDLLFNNVQNSQVVSSSRREGKHTIDLNSPQMETSWTSNEFVHHLQSHDEKLKSDQNLVHDSGSKGGTWPINCMQFLEDCRKNQLATQNLNAKIYHNGRTLALGSMPCDTTNQRTTDLSSRNHSPLAYMEPHVMPPQCSKGKSIMRSSEEHFSPFYYPISAKGTSSYGKVINHLRPKESISALDLLMLMQQGASSSTPSTSRREKIWRQPDLSPVYLPKPLGSANESFTSRQYPAPSLAFQGMVQSQTVRNTLNLFPSVGRSATNSSAPYEEQCRQSNLRLPFDFRNVSATYKQDFTPKNYRMEIPKQTLPATKILLPRPDESLVASGLLEHLKLPHSRKTLPSNLLESQNKIQMELSARSGAGSDTCTLNRNPAEFTLPDAGNIYMIGAEDLRPRKASQSKDNVDSRKRHRGRMGQFNSAIDPTADSKNHFGLNHTGIP